MLFYISSFCYSSVMCVSDNNIGILCSLCILGSVVICCVMFMSFRSNTTGVTSGAGTTYPSRAFPGLVGFALLNLQFYVQCLIILHYLFFCPFLLSTLLAVLLQFTSSDYFFFCIFKLLLSNTRMLIILLMETTHHFDFCILILLFVCLFCFFVLLCLCFVLAFVCFPFSFHTIPVLMGEETGLSP